MIHIIDCDTRWLEQIKKNLAELNTEYNIVKISDLENHDFRSASGAIITGGSTMLSVVDKNEFLLPFQIIKKLEIPVLGICLGHQILGLLYGAKIDHRDRVEKKERIELVRTDELFAEIENFSLFQEEHSEFITLPEEFALLARSRSAENETMKHKNKKMYGAQFHPELSGDNGKKIFRNFLKMCE